MIAPPPLPVRRFKFPTLALALIAAGWGLSFFLPAQGITPENTAGLIGYRCGQGAMSFALPIFITWLLWKLCRLESEGTKITAWIVSAILVAATLNSGAEEIIARRQANKRELEAMQVKVREQRKSGLAPDASYEDLQNANRKSAQIIEEAGQKMTGDEGKLMRAMSVPIRKLQRESAGYYELAAEMEKNPVLETTTIHGLEDIDRRLAVVEKLRQENEKLKIATTTFEQEIHEAIRTIGVSEAKQKESWAGFQSTFGKQKEKLFQMRSLDAELANRMQQVLVLLRDDWGKWDHNESRQLRFENGHSTDKYNEHIQRIQDIAAEEAKIQQQLSAM